jgi:hypothetical protein
MMSYKPAYYISLKKKSKRYEIVYNIGSESDITVVYRVGGKNSQQLFENITDILARLGGLIPIRITDREVVYGVREDLGPILGGLILASMRVRNTASWSRVVEEMLIGSGKHLQGIIPLFLEMSLELNRAYMDPKEKAKIQKVLSTTLRQFLKKLFKSKSIDLKK